MKLAPRPCWALLGRSSAYSGCSAAVIVACGLVGSGRNLAPSLSRSGYLCRSIIGKADQSEQTWTPKIQAVTKSTKPVPSVDPWLLTIKPAKRVCTDTSRLGRRREDWSNKLPVYEYLALPASQQQGINLWEIYRKCVGLCSRTG